MKRILSTLAATMLLLVGVASGAQAADLVTFNISSTVEATGDATYDWDRGTVVTFTQVGGPCSGDRCINVVVTDTTMCDAPGVNVLGCKQTLPDGTCQIEMHSGVMFDGYHYALQRSVLEHEMGHCLGLPHSQNSASVMYAAIETTQQANKYNTVIAEDRKNVDAIWNSGGAPAKGFGPHKKVMNTWTWDL